MRNYLIILFIFFIFSNCKENDTELDSLKKLITYSTIDSIDNLLHKKGYDFVEAAPLLDTTKSYAAKVYMALNDLYGEFGEIEKGAFSLTPQDFYNRINDSAYCIKIYHALNTAFGNDTIKGYEFFTKKIKSSPYKYWLYKLHNNNENMIYILEGKSNFTLNFQTDSSNIFYKLEDECSRLPMIKLKNEIWNNSDAIKKYTDNRYDYTFTIFNKLDGIISYKNQKSYLVEIVPNN